MKLVNEFFVPRPVDQAWAILTDVERIAPCMPGAQLTEVVGEEYHGTVKVKVGPVVAQYAGVATFREKDEANHRAVLEATGKEKSGRGRASAIVTAELVSSTSDGQGEGTKVMVTTDLTLAGPLAQFGRGAIAEISGRLLKQFVDCLQQTVLAEESPESEPAAAPPAAEVSAPPADPVATEIPPAPEVSPVPAAAPPTVSPTPADATRRAVTTPEAAPADLLGVAAGPILKRVIPLVIVVIAIVVILVLWLR